MSDHDKRQAGAEIGEQRELGYAGGGVDSFRREVTALLEDQFSLAYPDDVGFLQSQVHDIASRIYLLAKYHYSADASFG